MAFRGLGEKVGSASLPSPNLTVVSLDVDPGARLADAASSCSRVWRSPPVGWSMDMIRQPLGLGVLALFASAASVSPPSSAAWPHRATLTSLTGRPVAFHAYTLGGVLVAEFDDSGRPTFNLALSRMGALSARDTIHATTPANFPLDLSKGPVRFVSEGADSLHLVVGGNPFGSRNQVKADGRAFTVRLVGNKFVIDSR